MKCPNCGVEAPTGTTDCAGCGVIFAKFKAKKERAAIAADINLVDMNTPTAAPGFDPRKARAIAAGLVVAWVCGFGLYYHHAVSVVRAQRVKSPPR